MNIFSMLLCSMNYVCSHVARWVTTHLGRAGPHLRTRM